MKSESVLLSATSGSACFTNNEEEPFCWSRGIDAVRAHARHYWRHKIDVEYGVYVDQVEDDADGQEAEPTQAGHCEAGKSFKLGRSGRLRPRAVGEELEERRLCESCQTGGSKGGCQHC